MPKERPLARVKYYKEYGDLLLGECYAVEIYDKEDNDWGLDSVYPLRSYTNTSPKGDVTVTDKEFVHFSLLTRITWLFELGYEVDILGKKVHWV